jgi:hypothetical protein
MRKEDRMQLKEIRLMNESMIKYLESLGKSAQRNIIIKNILEDEKCFQKLEKEDSYMILKDVGISAEKIDYIYLNLVSNN